MEVELTVLARKQWKELRHDRTLFTRIEAALDKIEANCEAGKPLTGKLVGLRSYDVGDYRILYEIVDDELIVTVVKVGNRRDVYR